jgi:DNA-binding XRE family transcriptional regulator
MDTDSSRVAGEREVIRCGHCKLNQFFTRHGKCRRCLHWLREVEAAKPVIPVIAAPRPIVQRKECRIHLAIRALRMLHGLSQPQLAKIMDVPRTYICKVEHLEAHKRCSPTLATVERLADAFAISPRQLIELAMLEAA